MSARKAAVILLRLGQQVRVGQHVWSGQLVWRSLVRDVFAVVPKLPMQAIAVTELHDASWG